MMQLSRRHLLFGLAALPGCTALDVLGQSTPVRDIYALQPVNLPAQSGRTSRRLLVVLPAAPADIGTDRILIKNDPLSVTYLPDAQWSDTVPDMVQSVLVRSLASAGQFGFVGAQGDGPVPDTVLLTRIDAFEVNLQADGTYLVQVSFEMTVLRDRDQRVLGTRRFAQSLAIGDDRADTIARSFQHILDDLLPQIVTWVLARGA